MLPKYPIKAQNATNTESTDVAVFIVPDGAISGNEVDISAGGIAIGDTITDATEGSVLFAGAAGVLAQNNTAFKWVNADTQLQLTAGGATKTPLYVKLAGSQTADAFQVYASDGTTKRFAISGATPSLSAPQINFGTATTGIYSAGATSVQMVYSGVSRLDFDFSNNAVRLDSAGQFTWSGTSGNPSASNDIGLARVAAGVLKVTNSGSGAGALEFLEQTAPSAATANSVRIFAQDNGAGKTQLMALFATGAAQQIAIEP